MSVRCTGCDMPIRPKDNRVVYAGDPKHRPFCPGCAVHPFRQWAGRVSKSPLRFAPTCCGSWDCVCAAPKKKKSK